MVSTEKVLERNRGWKRFTVGASKASFVYCVGRVSISASHKLLTLHISVSFRCHDVAIPVLWARGSTCSRF